MRRYGTHVWLNGRSFGGAVVGCFLWLNMSSNGVAQDPGLYASSVYALEYLGQPIVTNVRAGGGDRNVARSEFEFASCDLYVKGSPDFEFGYIEGPVGAIEFEVSSIAGLTDVGLLVYTPDQEWFCVSAVNETASLPILYPSTGSYKVWVGSTSDAILSIARVEVSSFIRDWETGDSAYFSLGLLDAGGEFSLFELLGGAVPDRTDAPPVGTVIRSRGFVHLRQNTEPTQPGSGQPLLNRELGTIQPATCLTVRETFPETRGRTWVYATIMPSCDEVEGGFVCDGSEGETAVCSVTWSELFQEVAIHDWVIESAQCAEDVIPNMRLVDGELLADGGCVVEGTVLGIGTNELDE